MVKLFEMRNRERILFEIKEVSVRFSKKFLILLEPMASKRIRLSQAIQEGVRSFVRSGWLSVSAILTISLALFVIGLSGVEVLATQSILKSLEEKMDITVSFNSDISEERILAIKSELQKYKEIKSISYTSSVQALENFRKRSEISGNRALVDAAIEEIGENPLFASLSIRAHSPNQYKIINQSIESSSFKGDVFRINYRESESAINQFINVKKEVIRQGLVLGTIFFLIAFLVTFNTIRLTIYSRHEDFEIMRLVGASNLSIRIPSIVEGILYGAIASVVSLLFLFLFIIFQQSNPFVVQSVPLNQTLLFSYTSNIFLLFLILLIMGVFIGFLSGSLAVRRYLKV